MAAVWVSGWSSLGQPQVICVVTLSTSKTSPSLSHCVCSLTGRCFCHISMGFAKQEGRCLEGKSGSTWPMMMTPGKRKFPQGDCGPTSLPPFLSRLRPKDLKKGPKRTKGPKSPRTLLSCYRQYCKPLGRELSYLNDSALPNGIILLNADVSLEIQAHPFQSSFGSVKWLFNI